MGQTISYETTEYDLDLGKKGVIRGLQYDDKTRRYARIPYALPPTGSRRWRKPQPLPASFVFRGGNDDGTSSSPYDATKFGDACPQKVFHAVKPDDDPLTYSEDCLHVNIWTPVDKEKVEGEEEEKTKKKKKKKKWPVKLWLHGGWFAMGNASQTEDMSATELISTGGLDSIVVAIGYRLNVFGFLSGSALLEESSGESAGNFGLWDQRLAIEWVQQNIGLFGGDVDNITLAGRSAGAYSVEAQLLYEFRNTTHQQEQEPEQPPQAMFHRAFMCSNAIPAQPKHLRDVDAQFDELCRHFHIDAGQSGAEKLAQLRGVRAEALVNALSHLQHHTFRPITDDLFLHGGMYEYLQSAAFADAFRRRGFKLLIGEMRNEETLYAAYNSPEAPTREALRAQIANYYAPELTERILREYEPQIPDTEDLDAWKDCFGRIISDGQVRAPSRVLVRGLLAHGVAIGDIWRYRIDYRLSFITEDVAPKSYGVAHAMDRPIWNYSIFHGPTDAERVFMDEWIKILVAFVKNDPDYQFGTQTERDLKVATPEAQIEILPDERWDQLVKLGEIFGKSVDK